MTPESLTVADPPAPLATVVAANAVAEPQHVTTAEELEAFHTVRAILRGLVAPKRIAMRDAQSYCAILLDDNNRKPLCRLRFNNVQKLRLGIFNEKRDEEQVALDSVDDIYNYAEQLRVTASSYLVAQGRE